MGKTTGQRYPRGSDGTVAEASPQPSPGTGPTPTSGWPEVCAEWTLLPDALTRGPTLVAVVSRPGQVVEFSNTAFDRAFPAPPGPLERHGTQERQGTQERHGCSLVGVRWSGDVAGWDDVATLMDEAWSTGELTFRSGVPVLLRSPPDTDGLAQAYLTIMCVPLGCDGENRALLFVGADVTERVRTQLDVEQEYTRITLSERRHRDISLILQHSLLPPARPEVDDFEVAVRYLPGTKGTEVGGDWYDVVNLGAGRVAFVIGDVMGRGVRAAALMGQLRAAIRSYAHLDLPPAEVLRHLDLLLAELEIDADDDPAKITTCLYGVYDPTGEEVSVASAGHLPPVLVEPRGRAQVIHLDSGPPLGTDQIISVERRVPAPAGSLFVLYTDGLVERRDQDIDAGIETLRHTLHNGDDLEATADRILAELRPEGGYDDDVALLLLRVPALSAGRVQPSTILIPGSYHSAKHVRHHVRRVLHRWGTPADVVDTAVFVVDEIVTNALVHGEPPVRLTLRRVLHRVVIEVADSNPQLPRQRHIDIDAERGRGLHIVAATTLRWGSRTTTTGKVVWAEVSLPENHREAG